MKNQFKDDQDILEALRSQTPAAVNAALKHLLQSEKLRGFVRQQILGLGGAEADVREFLHQAILAFYNQVEDNKYNPALSSISTYIVKIAAQKFYTQRRSEGRRTAMYDRSVDAGVTETVTDPEAEMNQQHRKTVLDQVLSNIGDKCKQLLQLYGFQYSMAEIAEKIGYKSADVAKMAVQDCRKKLQQLLIQRPDLLAELREL